MTALARLTPPAQPARPRPRSRQRLPKIITDPIESAKTAGLRYVTDTGPGIRRKRAGKSFSYIGLDGQPIRDRIDLQRIKALGIPPAYHDVWICPLPNGHIQATGRDDKGRKQYRYHPRWREVRDETKYGRMIMFGEALPRLRERVDADLALPGLPREKVLATVVRLLEATLIRVGNEEYARKNEHFGLTTMREEHVDVGSAKVEFHFVGKSGKEHTVGVRDRRLARIVKQLQDLPGHQVFQYRDAQGDQHVVDSSDVNAYLREATGQDFTAKDFRTWYGTVLAARALHEFEAFDSQTQAKKNVMEAIKKVASRLGNTPAICRKCYVHPAVLDAYMEGAALHTLRERVEEEMQESLHALSPEEGAVLAFLRQRLAREEAAQSASGLPQPV